MKRLIKMYSSFIYSKTTIVWKTPNSFQLLKERKIYISFAKKIWIHNFEVIESFRLKKKME